MSKRRWTFFECVTLVGLILPVAEFAWRDNFEIALLELVMCIGIIIHEKVNRP